ncbi:hypothetical protein BDZ89DRAFT_475079 [Hymenopellis radicata]|nr:hypothetical protein BDZ89DRAFT_475079 [Hymenopellis radicata]
MLLILIMSSNGGWNDTDWWNFQTFWAPPQRIYHVSFTSSLLDGRILLDFSQDRPLKDLAEVMQVTLPYFREMNIRIRALSEARSVGYYCETFQSPSTFGPTTTSNIVTCLEVAQSIANMVPVFGHILEGACGLLLKIVQAAESARAARDECKALAEYTACITLAIFNEIGSRSIETTTTANVFDLCTTIGEVEGRTRSLSKLGRIRYFASRGRINAEIKELRARVDNARIVFKVFETTYQQMDCCMISK